MSITHVVSEAITDSVGLSADACLKCNACNTVCPVARVTDLFPGPKYVGPQAQRFRLDPTRSPHSDVARPLSNASPDHTVDLCSSCGYCTTACPTDVKVAEINSRARARMREGRRAPLRDWLIGHPDILGRVGVPFAPLANFALRNRLGRLVAHAALGIHRDAPVPAFARRTFQSRWRRRRAAAGAGGGASRVLPDPSSAVVYFHGCAADHQEPHVAEAIVAVLERNGFEVLVPAQSCCGLPLISQGLYAHARRQAMRNFAVLGDFARRGYRIVGGSTSCTHTLKAEYREMLDLDDDDARAISAATWDICEFLLALHEEGRLDSRFGTLDMDLPYHPPCQLRSHGIGAPALDLFALVPGLRARDMDHDCCGIAGTYGLKREKYDIAMAVGAPLFRRIRASGASMASCDSETCRWQIEKATGTPVRHPVEILATAYAAGDAERAASRRPPQIVGSR